MKRLASTCKSFLAVCLLSGLCNVVSAQASSDAPLEVTAPAGGALSQGSLLAVRWRDHRAALTPVYVYLRDALSGTEREIGSNLQSGALAAESSFDWFIPTDVSPGNYAIVLRTFDGSQQASSAAFALTPVVSAPGVIRVLNPPRWAGELPTFAEAERVNVMWDFQTGRPEAVDIVLDVYADHRYAGSKTIASRVAALASTGLAQTSLPWAAAPIDGCIPATARYRMRMLGERGAVGQSSDFFSISSAHEVDRSACPDSTPQPQPPSPPPPQPPAPPSPPASGVQPLPNGSFETFDAASGRFANWIVKIAPPAAGRALPDSTSAFAGAVAIRFDIDVSAPADQPWLVQLSHAQPLSLEAGRAYAVDLAARADPPRTITVVLQEDAPPWRVFAQQDLTVSNTLERHQATMTVTPNLPATNAALRFNLPGAGAIWLDDVRFGPSAEPTPEPPPSTPQPPAPPAPPTSSDPVDPVTPSGAQPVGRSGGWRLVFSDEFNGDRQNDSKWVNCYLFADFGCFKTYGSEAEWYLPRNAVVGGGAMHLIARREATPIVGTDGSVNPFSSGIISTGKDHGNFDASVPPRFGFQYGFVEARLKLPRNAGEPRQSTGLWPAFWMLPVSRGAPECGAYEHDVLEMFGQPYRAYMTVHWPDCNGQFSQHGSFFDQIDSPDFTDDFHIFGFEWEADALTWYIDGVVRKRYVDAGHIFRGGPMYVNLNLAIGGFAGDPGAITAPVEMVIDYVRIWQR